MDAKAHFTSNTIGFNDIEVGQCFMYGETIYMKICYKESLYWLDIKTGIVGLATCNNLVIPLRQQQAAIFVEDK